MPRATQRALTMRLMLSHPILSLKILWQNGGLAKNRSLHLGVVIEKCQCRRMKFIGWPR